MARTYRLWVDWDQDEYFCRGVQPSDPLNLIKGALQKTLKWDDVWHYPGYALSRRYETHDSGLWIYRAQQNVDSPFLNSVPNAIMFGSNRVDPIPAGEPMIPVTPGATYTARVLVRPVVGNTALLMSIDAGAIIGSIASTTATGTLSQWTPLTITFTVPADVTLIRIWAGQQIAAVAQMVDVRGLMLVAGSTMPAVWNAGDPTNAYDDISAYVSDSISFSDGLPYDDDFAAPSLMEFALRNEDGIFDPANTESPFYASFRQGIYLRLEAEKAGVIYPLWHGVTDRLTFYGEDGYNRFVYVEAQDAALWMTDSDFNPRYYENITVDAALKDPFERGAVIFPYAGSFGVLGASTLGDSMTVYDQRMTDFRTADTTLPFSGDNIDTGQGVNLQAFLRETLAAELGGRFFYDATRGKYIFHNRLRDAVAPLVEFSPGEPLDAPPPELSYGEDVINHVDLNYEVRKIGASATVVWSMDDVPFTVAAQRSRTINARYTSTTTDMQIAVKNGILPVNGTDVTASFADGAFENAINFISVTAVFEANTARVTISNTTARPVNVTMLQLRGTPITRTKSQSVVARNPRSIARNGLKKRALNISSIASETFAQRVADVRAAQSSTPVKLLKRVAFTAEQGEATEDTILQARVGDVLRFSAIDGAKNYLVLARDHRISLDQDTHYVNYTIKALVRTAVLVLGSPLRGQLDQALLGL